MKPILSIVIFLLMSFCHFIEAQSKIKLFNNKNLEGWYAYEPESGKHRTASDIFHVDHNMIRLYGDRVGYLMSNQSFKNFKLTVEYKWNIDSNFIRKSDKKNSGVMYLISADTKDTLWPKGFQFQIKEGATGDFVLLQDVTLFIKGLKTEPGRSVVSPRFLDAEKPIGNWNTLVINCLNGNIKQLLNGEIVNEGTLWRGQKIYCSGNIPDMKKPSFNEA